MLIKIKGDDGDEYVQLADALQRKPRVENELDLKALVGESDRTMLVAGLQALHRERVAAWNAAVSVAIIRNAKQPGIEQFGIDEVSEMLRRVGAAPSSY